MKMANSEVRKRHVISLGASDLQIKLAALQTRESLVASLLHQATLNVSRSTSICLPRQQIRAKYGKVEKGAV